MALKRGRICLTLGVIAALWYSPRRLFSCGPFFPSTVFTYTWHPDFPLDRFAHGELGVLQPTYARSYLAVAYRYLSGVDLNPEEQKALQALWQERLEPRWNADGQDWIQRWLDVRNSVPGVSSSPQITIYRFTVTTDGSRYCYLNCPDDAFRTAVSTLGNRIAQFGADSAAVRDWVAAQDQVFANCARGQTIPTPASPGLPALMQADRAYQIAAAHFYIGDYDTATQMFAAIAEDRSSPWRQTAPYLLARALFRQAILRPRQIEEDRVLLAQAAAQARAVLDDNSLSEVHPAAQRLLNRIQLRLQPAERLHSLAETIVQENIGGALKQSLWDYTMLLDTLLGEGDVFDAAQKRAQLAQNFAAQVEIRSKDDLTDWLLIF